MATESRSLGAQLATLPAAERAAFLASLDAEELAALEYAWEVWARPSQLEPPGDWSVWLICAGRGYGKTRCAAETVRKWVESGRCKRLALVARTAADVRDVVVEGESGILAISPPWCRPTWEPTKRRLTWPNGAVASTFSAEDPDILRGPQFDGAWADEIATWRYEETWTNLLMGLRLGAHPRVVVSTTPRPTKLMRSLMADSATIVTRGATKENQANLAPTFLAQQLARYAGTRLARQELEGELLEEAEGALWGRDGLDAQRVRPGDVPELVRVVVAVDPATTSKADSDETGIVVAGVAGNGNAYVLDDLSGRYSPDGWAKRAVLAFEKHRADRIVLETNQGGDMVVQTIRTVMPNAPLRRVSASRGKRVRAEPVAALYEQGRVFHVGALPELEDQMVCWDASTGAPSPDRVDALVWALTDLAVTGRRPAAYESIRIQSRRWC